VAVVTRAHEAVLFDFGGTLDAEGMPWKDRVARLFHEEGVRLDARTFDPVFYAADDALVGRIPTTLPFEDTVGRLVRGVAIGLGLEDDTLVDRVAKAFVEHARRTVHRNGPLLSALAQRYRLGIVSNFYGNLATVAHDCGVDHLFGVIADSSRIGYSKPDPRIFHAALTALGTTAAAAVFVGDSRPRDMAGARGVGMPHIWLRPVTAAETPPCCPGDQVIATLADLRSLLF
jgi:FMN phosphatase YigB (HAD superfamily)